MSKKDSGEQPGGEPAGTSGGILHPAKTPRKSPISLPLVVVFAIVLLGGTAYGLTREMRYESYYLKGMNDCGASAFKLQNSPPEKDGLQDLFGLVEFNRNHTALTQYLSACEMEPEMALRVYRKAMDEGTASARMVALYSTFYLSLSKKLEAADWERLTTRLNPDVEKELDVKRIAQRSASDLLVIPENATKSAFIAIPEGFKETEKEAAAPRVELKDVKVNGQKYLAVRWSTPALAWAWLQTHAPKGKWDSALQRFVIAE
jgi:hypothetical protein